MKKTVICFCFFAYMLMSLTTAASAKAGYYSCDSDPEDFNEKVFDDITIDTGACDGSSAMLENVTVTGDVHLTGGSVSFSRSDLNRMNLDCPAGSHCGVGLDGETGLKELELHPGAESTITISGLMRADGPLPSFYGKGYLCEGQPEFAAYSGADTSIDYQLQDLETFDILGEIDTVRIIAAADAAVTLDNIGLNRTFILADDGRSPRNFTVNTAGFAFINLLDSGISFGLHNLNLQHLPQNHGRHCSYIAGDQMNIGLLLLHSDADLKVSMDRQYIDYVVFFGAGCDHSTLTLDAYAGSSQVSDVYQIHVYDANAEFYNKSIQGVYFLIAPDEAPYDSFYQFFDHAEDLLRNRRSDFTDSEMLRYLPDADSDYWDQIDAALIWSQLMPYYNIKLAGSAADGISMVYNRSEPDVPYIYYHATYIDKVRVLNAYGSSDGMIPDYIKQKNWTSPNPFMTGSTVRLCENGGCGFNHQMSLGTVSFDTSIRDIPKSNR